MHELIIRIKVKFGISLLIKTHPTNDDYGEWM